MSAGLSVAHLIAALQRKAIPLPYEAGAFLVLEASEHAAAEPIVLSSSELKISESGELVMPTRTSAAAPSPREVCKGLAGVLGELLVCSAQSVPPMLLRLVESGGSEGPADAAELRDELQATLVPLNRSAMRRVLARLVREARRDWEESRPRMSLHPQPADAEHELDAVLGGRAPAAEAELDAVLAGRGKPMEDELDAVLAGPSPRERVHAVADAEIEAHIGDEESAELDAVLAGLDRGPSDAKPSRPDHTLTRHGSVVPPAARSGVPLTPRPSLALGDQHDALDRFESAATQAKSSLGTRIGWAALVVVAALVAGAVLLGRERSRDLVGLERDALPSTPARAPTQTRRYGTLRITSVPSRAQVLLRVGTGPALAAKLPVGVVHEFVALRPGFSPARGLVAADAEWKPQAGELRYELALQLREASSPAKENELGSAQLPAALGAPTGALGTVRVVTSPPAADVYELIGFTPDVKVENLPIDEPLQLLVYRADHELRRLTVGPGDWKGDPAAPSADLEITLTKRGNPRERK